MFWLDLPNDTMIFIVCQVSTSNISAYNYSLTNFASVGVKMQLNIIP